MTISLPIEQHLSSIQTMLAEHTRLILVAQPGAGKTTRVPLMLLSSAWAQGQRLLLVEPQLPLACGVAALLESRERVNGPLQKALAPRFAQPSRYPQWQKEAERLARVAGTTLPRNVSYEALGTLLALAYPDRVGQLITLGRFKLANGKTATLPSGHSLANASYLVAVSLESASSEAAIYLAESMTLAALTHFFPGTQRWVERIYWSESQRRLVGETVQYHGELVLASRPLTELPAEAVQRALLIELKQRPQIVFTKEVKQLQGRMALLHRLFPDQWPDWSDEALMSALDTWLSPYLVGMVRMSQLEKMPFHTHLWASLTWEEQAAFDQLVPKSLPVPSGRQVRLDYAPCLDDYPPVLALKLQEAFGWQDSPTVARGYVVVLVHLLSPAKRPLQVTQDLRSFWLNGYPEVRKEMRGRYPPYPWPSDPVAANATAKTKQGSGSTH